MARPTAKQVLAGIKGVGGATQHAVLSGYPTLEDLEQASIDDLTNVKGVGPATAKAIKEAVAKADAGATPTASVGDTTTVEAKAATGATKAKAGTKAAASKAQQETGERAAAARDTATTTAKEAKQRVDAEVVEIGRARDRVEGQADNAVSQVRGAITSVQNIIIAALDAGKEQWPQTERQLKAALTSLRKTGQTLVEAAKDVRRSG